MKLAEDKNDVIIFKGKAFSKQKLADLGIISVAIMWGISTVVVKVIVSSMPPFTFITVRFTLAALFLALIYRTHFQKVQKKDFMIGLSTGVFLFGTYGFQIIGLKYTTVSNATFIGALSVVLIPLCGSLIARKIPSLYTLISVSICTIGLYFLAGLQVDTVNLGDLLNLLSAFSFTTYIMVIAKYANDMDTVVVTVFQFASVVILAAIGMLTFEPVNISLILNNWLGIIYTAIFATALVIPMQLICQKYTSPIRVGIYMLLEPVSATLIAVVAINEYLSIASVIGCCLILIGMLLAQIKEI